MAEFEAGSPDRRPVARATWVGLALVVLGLLLWAAYRLTAGGERHSYAVGSTPPTTVQLTQGQRYSIGVAGGVRTLEHDDLEPSTTECTIGRGAAGSKATLLGLTPENDDTKATNQIATFVSPVTGRVSLDCEGVAGAYVDNADDSHFDQSTLWLVLGSVALAVGLPLTLSGLRRYSLRSTRVA